MSVIGVDVGGSKIRAGIVEKNKLIKAITQKVHSKSPKDKIIQQIIQIINPLFNKRVTGIGIGVPAIADSKTGTVYEPVNIRSLDKVPLKKILQKKFKVPVIVNNDANCFALGEKYFGKGKKYKDLVGLIIGTGVGAGIIINGKLYSGQNCAAGEFGKIAYLKHDIEHYCSGKFFQNEYNIDGEALFQKALRNDKTAKEIFKTYGKHLGKALSIITSSLDPQIIILGGSVSKAHNFFKKSMNASLKDSVYTKTFKNLKIKASLNKNIALLGAASLFTRHLEQED